MTTVNDIARIRGRIGEIGTRQADLADCLGIHETLLNAILRGRRPMPTGMEARIHAALDLLEEEKRVAEEAVAKLRAAREKAPAQGVPSAEVE